MMWSRHYTPVGTDQDTEWVCGRSVRPSSEGVWARHLSENASQSRLVSEPTLEVHPDPEGFLGP